MPHAGNPTRALSPSCVHERNQVRTRKARAEHAHNRSQVTFPGTRPQNPDFRCAALHFANSSHRVASFPTYSKEERESAEVETLLCAPTLGREPWLVVRRSSN